MEKSQDCRDASFQRFATWATAAFVALAIGVAYWGTWSVPFLLDDSKSILENPTIERFWPPWQALSAPTGSGTTPEGRPIYNLSLAFNRSIGGFDPAGYHVVNVLIHLANAGLVFVLVRSVLRAPVLPSRWTSRADLVAGGSALWWAVHPLQTVAVTYISQRAEVLVSFFYLSVLIGVAGAAGGRRSGLWSSIAVVSALAGMATKEVMATAPILGVMLDRVFFASSWQTLWHERGRMHVAIAASWLLLAGLVFVSGSRGGTAGFGVGVSSWHYLLTQTDAVVRYLALVIMPVDLVFDYGTGVETEWSNVVGDAALLVATLCIGTVLLCKRRVLGFPLVAFFVILAPSSSVVPVVTQTIAEHRAYLASMMVIVMVVVGLCAALSARGATIAILAVGGILTAATRDRNRDYASARSIWEDTVAKRPDNVRARLALGVALENEGDLTGAVRQWHEALRLEPDDGGTHYVIGNAHSKAGKHALALEHLRESVRLRPDYAPAHYDCGNELARAGDMEGAVICYREAIALGIDGPVAWNNLGSALARLGRTEEAIVAFSGAVEAGPESAAARTNLAVHLMLSGQAEAALLHLQESVRLAPEDARAWYLLGDAWVEVGQDDRAVHAYETVLRLQPRFPMADVVLRTCLNRLAARRAESNSTR